MDKGSNISFPSDSGSTVYNGSGISVGGKASTDILHAAGGTTKIKTLNGESILGEGNIIIDPSSVPVSLSWYNRTSSQQDATINLTIGDTTVNLFPNIFKLFKAGKVSTSESLSIELTANPGVSGVPQVPTSLCQWSIPLADSNTAGIISSEDKAKLDNLSDPKNLLAYGVEWDSTNSSPVLTRIGNMSLHKSLPIQSALRGCVCQGKRIMYYLDPNDWSKKADGTEFYWLYVIEYANFNSQANYVEDLTEDGYRQGGLGNGVTTWSDTVWGTYNGRCPITPCGYCNEFGNFTGIKDLVIPASDGINTITFKVPRYRGVIPVSATPTDVYVAINSQYHDYVELFKSWFGDNVDQKIIESAIIFWFKDVDCKAENKVVEYLGEY